MTAEEILQQIAGPVWVVDGGDALLSFNNAFARAFQSALGRLPQVGENVSAELSAWNANFSALYASARIARQLRVTCELEGEDGLRTFDLDIRAVDDGAVLVSGVDVTERDRAASRLALARARAERDSRGKTTFVATISHEIRTALTAILGMSELMRDTPLQTDQQDYMSSILRNVHSLSDLIDAVVDYAQLSENQLTLNPEPLNLKQLVANVVEDLTPRAQARCLTLTLRLHDGSPENIEGDPVRLRQILANLIGNAIKYTDAGSVHVALTGTSLLRISVRDTGPGIPIEMRDRVFEWNERLPGESARKKGSGLGLAITKHLAELMGGTIALESRLGEGSTFALEFTPAQVAGVLSFEPSMDSEAIKGHGRVLILEDHPDTGHFMKSVLEGAGIEATLCETCEGATEAIQRQCFDLLVVDVDLPDGHGLSWVGAIRAREHQAGVPSSPVLVATAQADPDTLSRVQEAQLEGFIAKPLTRGQLLAAVSQVVDPRPRVLFVDDSADGRLALVRLSERVCRGVATGTLAEATHLLQNHPFDLVVTDLSLDGESGVDLARTLVEDGPPVAIISGHAPGTVDLSEISVVGQLQKPVDRVKLEAALRQWTQTNVQTPQTHQVRVDPDLEDLIPPFLEERTADLQRAQDALQNQDFSALSALGHKIKGNAPAYGFSHLGQLAEALENAAEQQDEQGCATTIHDMRQHLGSVVVSTEA